MPFRLLSQSDCEEEREICEEQRKLLPEEYQLSTILEMLHKTNVFFIWEAILWFVWFLGKIVNWVTFWSLNEDL